MKLYNLLRLAVAVAASGCAGESNAVPETSGTAVSIASSTSLRLQEYASSQDNPGVLLLSVNDAAAINHAIELQVAECMAGAGFEYTPRLRDLDALTEARDVAEAASRPFTSRDLDRWGTYPTGELMQQREASPPDADYLTEMSQAELDEYYRALHGHGTDQITVDLGYAVESMSADGCYFEARSELFPDVESFLFGQAFMADLRSRAAATVRSTDHFVSAERDWATCMNEHGFVYTSYLQPRDRDVAGAPPTEIPRADAACTERVSLHTTFESLMTTELLTLVEAEVARFEEYRRHREHAVQRASQHTR